MGKTIKVAALVAAFFFAGPSFANKATAKELCELFADLVYQVAMERDAGQSKYALRNRVHKNFDHPDLRDLAFELVDLVYREPWGAPAHEANSFKMGCFEEAGIVNRS